MFDKIMIGRNIGLLIKRWGMKQQAFAELFFSDMNRHKISSYVRDGSKPSVEFMIILRRLTGLEVEDLFLGELDPEELPAAPIAQQVFEELQNKYGISIEEKKTPTKLSDRMSAMEEEIQELRAEVKELRERLEG